MPSANRSNLLRTRKARLVSAISLAGAVAAGSYAATSVGQEQPGPKDPFIDNVARQAPQAPVGDVSPATAARFRALRKGPVGVPDSVAKVLGGSGGPTGKNLSLARAIQTATGRGWVFPAAGNRICLAAPMWMPAGGPSAGYGMTCGTPEAGVTLTFEDAEGAARRTVLVPDGGRVEVGGDTLSPDGDGVVSVDTPRGVTARVIAE